MDPNDIPLDLATWAQRGPYSRSHLYDLIREGELRAVKVGVKTLIYPSEMQAHLKRNARPVRLKGMATTPAREVA